MLAWAGSHGVKRSSKSLFLVREVSRSEISRETQYNKQVIQSFISPRNLPSIFSPDYCATSDGRSSMFPWSCLRGGMRGWGTSLAYLLALIASCGDAFLAPYAAVSSPDHKSLQEHGAVSLGNHGVQRNGLPAVFRLRGCFARALAGESWTSRDRTRSWPCIGSLVQRTQRRRLHLSLIHI